MKVSACLVTNNPDPLLMQPVLDSLPEEWEKIIWNNAGPWVIANGPFGSYTDPSGWPPPGAVDLSVYGRYEAIRYAAGDLIYVQDDDVIVSDPQAIVAEWRAEEARTMERGWAPREGSFTPWSHVVCNMPEAFRANYDDAALVGFGAVFHREAPARAFARLDAYVQDEVAAGRDVEYGPLFWRECDRAFTVLTPRVLVDVPKEDREFASAPDRLWKQPEHHHATRTMLELARQARDR